MRSVAGVTALIVTASVVLVCESAAVGQAQPTTPPTSKFPGPCRAWLFPCEEGSWVCTTEAAYWGFIFGSKPDCPSLHPHTTPPPPGECQLVNGTCQFTHSTLKCKTWVDSFNGNKCGSETEYTAFMKGNGLSVPEGFGQYPSPNQLCLPLNNTCQWYDPCLSWRCSNDNICGSADEYYAFLYGPPPSCPPSPGQVPPDPPGQCAIRKDHCDWYECTSWIGWCDDNWLCGTVYDKETYEAGPPPPCPPPPPNHHPPVQPGICRFNVSSGRCGFFPNTTDPCSQPIYPPDFVPRCDGLQKRWTYNKTIGQCLEFYYFPCAEDRNGHLVYDVFVSEEECIKTCVHKDPCSQPIYPPDFVPRCDWLQKRWTYNKTIGQCLEFYYFPCAEDREGHLVYDVFVSEEECVKTCVHKECVSWIGWCGSSWSCGTVREWEISKMIPPPPCPLPPRPPVKPGTCRFNISDGQCRFFPNTTCSAGKVYKSCGTACPKTCANYNDLSQPCTSQCVPGCFCPSGTVEHNGQCINPSSCPVEINPNPCKQPIYPPGYKPICGMLEHQWTFNSTIGQCVAFAYSPCGEEREGYDVFTTQEECMHTCMHQDPCSQPIYPPHFVPRCDVLEKQWTYNKTIGQCLEFYYHPCLEDREGYDVFVSEEECIKTCVHKDPCKQSIYPPGYIPSCTVVQKQWTYNQTSGQCVEFNYHPCGEDREGYDVFATELECMKTCLHKDPCHQSIYPPGYQPSCRLLMNQWTYNPQSGQCIEFEYYPCGEDRDGYDVFATEQECVNTCVH